MRGEKPEGKKGELLENRRTGSQFYVIISMAYSKERQGGEIKGSG